MVDIGFLIVIKNNNLDKRQLVKRSLSKKLNKDNIFTWVENKKILLIITTKRLLDVKE